MNATCIRIEGGLLSPDFLERIHEMEGQKPRDFELDGRRALIDEVSSVWGDVRVYWSGFQRRLARGHGESVTTITREQWVIPLLEALGYELTYQPRAVQADGRAYTISHRAGADDAAPPVHIVGRDQDLGSRPPSGRGQMSPHALVQDYLNRTDHLWGIVTNGSVLRFLRDSSYFTRPAYIEFDLEQLLDGERLDEFILFYRLTHRTRLPATLDDAPACWLERYHQQAIEQGGRIREGLRRAVEQAIRTFANGFLSHPKNEGLREQARSGALSVNAFYQQLLYIIYRLLFLMVAEERNLLAVGDEQLDAERYRSYSGLARLRALADESLSAPERFDDLYLSLRALFHVLRDERCAARLGLPPLNGELFEPLPALEQAYLNNRTLLTAIASLSYFTPPDEHVPRRVNYAGLDVEELGSVYESLLDFQPRFTEQGGRLEFGFIEGTERKTTGSYYTRSELVQELIKSALDPVIEGLTPRPASLRGKGEEADRPQSTMRHQQEQALLSLRVCDPACGSGHFLLAAARRIGRELAKVRTGDDEPSPDAVRDAVRDAIIHCIYGVDKNPLAVDLCKVALWLEGHSTGKPLTFLDHRIRCGDSLVGVRDLSVLEDGIPDEAFDPVTGDDKTMARSLKQHNRQERIRGQTTISFDVGEELSGLLDARRVMETLSDDTPGQVREKQAAFQRLQQQGSQWWHDQTGCHLWTAAFFAELTQAHRNDRHIPTTDDLRRAMETPNALDGRLTGFAWVLATRHRFFHWPLEFPEVFANGGFDVVLSNPPWERIKLQEQEFFATRDIEIARASNKAARERLIRQLPETNPDLWREYQQALHDADALSKCLRGSGRFLLTARGDINTYAIFTEHVRRLLSPKGRAGIIVPTGIATDDTTKAFFGDLIDKQTLAQLIGFENEAFIFPDVHHAFKFCTLTMTGEQAKVERADFAFLCRHFEHVQQVERHFELSHEDFTLLNPNTRTCPIFRTRTDAELTKKIYRRVPVLVNEQTGENPWGVKFLAMFHMANDSGLFVTAPGDDLLPLYEAKMMHQFDHRYATYEGATQANLNAGILPQPSDEQKQDPTFAVRPRYWVPRAEVEARLGNWQHGWLIGFRNITSSVVERTAIFAALPLVGVGHSAPLIFLNGVPDERYIACFLANVNSLVTTQAGDFFSGSHRATHYI